MKTKLKLQKLREPNEPEKLLIAALRSGRFVRGRNALKKKRKSRGYCYCPLGVACRVYMENVGPLQTEKHGQYVYYEGDYVALPGKVQEWYGWSYSGGSLVASIQAIRHDNILGLNDSDNLTFGQIANIIEAGYIKLAA